MKLVGKIISIDLKLAIGSAWFDRKWPPEKDDYILPTYSEIELYIKNAISNGVTVIDTAPAYGDAENIIGKFIERNRNFQSILKIFTKWGAIYEKEGDLSYLDHSLDMLEKSWSKSKKLLNDIEGLYIHGCNKKVISDKKIVDKMVSLTDSDNLNYIGVSVKDDIEVLNHLIIKKIPFNVVQVSPILFFSAQRQLKELKKKGYVIFINAPIRRNFIDISIADKYRILKNNTIVDFTITGTRNHLMETINIFME